MHFQVEGKEEWTAYFQGQMILQRSRSRQWEKNSADWETSLTVIRQIDKLKGKWNKYATCSYIVFYEVLMMKDINMHTVKHAYNDVPGKGYLALLKA